MTSPEINNREKIDQILLGEGSLKELAPYFPDREAILQFHARRMMEMFPPGKQVETCEACHSRPAESQVSLLWRGIFHTAGTLVATFAGMVAAMGGHGIMAHRHMDFTTTHGLCGGCLRQMRLKKILGELAEKICFIFIFLAAIVFTISLVFTPVLLFLRPTTREILIMVIGVGGGLACLIGGLWGANKAVRWYLPKSLKFISKQPFQLIGLKKL